MDDATNKLLNKKVTTERKRMQEVFKKIIKKSTGRVAKDFLSMSKDYFNDSGYFLNKGDMVRSFEAIVISWAYIDAGIKADFFAVPDELKDYFTS